MNYYDANEIGWFGSKLAKKVSKGVSKGVKSAVKTVGKTAKVAAAINRSPLFKTALGGVAIVMPAVGVPALAASTAADRLVAAVEQGGKQAASVKRALERTSQLAAQGDAGAKRALDAVKVAQTARRHGTTARALVAARASSSPRPAARALPPARTAASSPRALPAAKPRAVAPPRPRALPLPQARALPAPSYSRPAVPRAPLLVDHEGLSDEAWSEEEESEAVLSFDGYDDGDEYEDDGEAEDFEVGAVVTAVPGILVDERGRQSRGAWKLDKFGTAGHLITPKHQVIRGVWSRVNG